MAGEGNSSSGSAQPSAVSRWLGVEGEELTLARARHALALSARAAGVPSWLWIAGICYPALDLLPGGVASFGFERSSVAGASIALHEQIAISMVLMMLVFPVRLIVGLAACSTPRGASELEQQGRRPRLRDCWRAGKGLTLSGFALTLQMLLMACTGLALLLAPPFFFLKGLGLDPASGLFLALLTPFVGLFLVFLALVSVIYQVSLSSLAHNRRGAGSAMMHGWRVARHRPWATVRAALVDLVLWVTERVMIAITIVVLAIPCISIPLIPAAILALMGFVGVTRARYWACIYRELGGLSPEDGVPGLGAVTPPPLPRAS